MLTRGPASAAPFPQKARMDRFPGRRPLLRLLAAAALLGPSLAAAPAAAETLEEALAQAYAGHPRLLAARADLAVATARIGEAEAAGRPLVDGGLGARGVYRHTEGNNGGSSDTTLGGQAEVMVTQRLFDFDVVSGSIDTARASMETARSRLLEAEQEVLHAAAVAYLGLLRAEAGVQLARRGEEVIASDLKATRDKYEVGEVTQTDVAQAEARLADRRAARVKSESQLETARAAYREATGESPTSSLAFPAELPGLPGSLEEAERTMVESHPALQALRSEIDVARHSLRSAKGRILPTVDAVGRGVHAENPNTFFDRSSEYSIGITVDIPLYAGGRSRAAVMRLEEALAGSMHSLDAELRVRRRRATSAWEAFTSASDGLSAFEASVRANEIASEGVRREAEVGSRTTLDVLDAELELLQATDNLDQARHDVHVAAYDLRRAIGSMTASDWNLPAGN